MGYEAAISAEGQAGSGGNRLLRMLGLGTRAADQGTSKPVNKRLAERAVLLDSISEFLLRHELAISIDNLIRAHGIRSGTNMRLARKVAALEDAGEPITQAWLDQQDQVKGDNDSTSDSLDKLARDLDNSMAKFTENTRTAQQAASSYGDELQKQVELVDEVQTEENVVANLAQIAHAMLERTRDMEDQMRKGEEEARDLRRNLAKARHDATIDHLTNLPNRRAFEEVFKKEWLEAQREMQPLCLAICDIDFFKNVNDVHGHDTGDRIIRAVAQALDRISDNCHVARHGGEEFVLLFRGLDVAGSMEALDGARDRFAARHFVDKVSGKPIGGVTFSGGVTDVFAHPDLSSALRRADEALYAAKEAGRNQIKNG